MLPYLIGSVNASHLDEEVSQNQELNESTTIGTSLSILKLMILLFLSFSSC